MQGLFCEQPGPAPSPAKQSGNGARVSCLVEISSLLGIAGRACLGAPRRCSWTGFVGLRCGGTPRYSKSWLPIPTSPPNQLGHGTKAALLSPGEALCCSVGPAPESRINDKEARKQCGSQATRSAQKHRAPQFFWKKAVCPGGWPTCWSHRASLPGASLVSSLVTKRSRGLN